MAPDSQSGHNKTFTAEHKKHAPTEKQCWAKLITLDVNHAMRYHVIHD
jgi:hypothetical protein